MTRIKTLDGRTVSLNMSNVLYVTTDEKWGMGMTVNELIEKLQKLTPEERELPVCNYSLLDPYAINEFEYYDEIVDEAHVDEITNPANSELTVGEKAVFLR